MAEGRSPGAAPGAAAGSRYFVVSAPGYVRLQRVSPSDGRDGRRDARVLAPGGGGGLVRGSLPYMTSRSSFNLRCRVLELPWERLGSRPLLLTLTYPRDWRSWCSGGADLEAHRRRFVDAWAKKWGPPVGLWVKEFQLSGRPHLHLYLAGPDGMTDEEYGGLRERTLIGVRLVREFGKFEGRAKMPPLSRRYGGQFGYWCRHLWSQIVTGGTDGKHFARGADVRVFFYSERAEH